MTGAVPQADVLAEFPNESVPDGAVFGPHHAYIGVLLALLAMAVVWDNAPQKEPLATAAALLGATFAFATVWPFYSTTGALLALAGIMVAIVALFALPFWNSYAWFGPRGLAILGALIALDDVLEHAFGVPTPLDWLWKAHIVQHIH